MTTPNTEHWEFVREQQIKIKNCPNIDCETCPDRERLVSIIVWLEAEIKRLEWEKTHGDSCYRQEGQCFPIGYWICDDAEHHYYKRIEDWQAYVRKERGLD